ncbi:hypothetical protein [Homoserinibacter sp. GY 40078]|uniref:hypothetical protein n=1 Tax=Homoserinibacter sp. GY 40078 TaxID=2603275 RepID=UPI0011CB87C2|nr:hypothetical protein [Homoserinibacter sp. GY 40078]TXK17097.1 hypothetical protein FVQ89_09475 [Homoserinibacter sp. GY 40078]
MTMTERLIPRARRDDAMTGTAMVLAFRPLQVPSRAALVDALERIARADPERRVILRDGGSGWSSPRDDEIRARCEDTIRPLDDPDADIDLIVADVRRHAADRPLTFLISDDTLVQVGDHRLFDGVVTAQIAGVLVAVAMGAEAPDMLRSTDTRRPVVAALRTTFLRHPGTARRVIASKFDRAATAANPAADGTPSPPAGPPVAAAATARLGARAYAEVRRWARDAGALPTVADVELGRAVAARAGVRLVPPPTVLVDLRRYLPAGARVSSNFVTGVPLAGTDPESASAGLRTDLANGRPLAGFALGMLTPRRTRTGASEVATGTRLIVTSIGRVRAIEQLPWSAPPAEQRLVVYVDPGTAGAITLITLLSNGVLHLTTAFDEARIPRRALTAALALVADDPLSALAPATAPLAETR